MTWTGTRVPRMTGFPARIAGSTTMRDSTMRLHKGTISLSHALGGGGRRTSVVMNTPKISIVASSRRLRSTSRICFRLNAKVTMSADRGRHIDREDDVLPFHHPQLLALLEKPDGAPRT